MEGSLAYTQQKATKIQPPAPLNRPSPGGIPSTAPATNYDEHLQRKAAALNLKLDANGQKRFTKAFGYSLNTAINVAAQLKEVSTLASCAPGIRQFAGCCLHILETIGLMGDMVAAFDQLASQALDNCLMIVSCMEIIDEESDVAEKAKAELNKVATEFDGVMQKILKAMKDLNSRGKITRFIFAKADKNDLEKHRNAMNHLLSKLQVALHLANLAKRGGENRPVKQLTEEITHKAAERYTSILGKRSEEEYDRQVKEYNNSAEVHNNASVNFNTGDNANVYKSGNVSTKIISGQNDYSNNVNNFTLNNGDFRMDGGRRRRRGDRNSSSDSYDSDERDTPRQRREGRRRRNDEHDYSYDDRRW